MAHIFFRPGQQLKKCLVYRRQSNTNSMGRVSYGKDMESLGVVYGSISSVSEKEMLRWRQLEHTVTHTFVMRSRLEILAGDVLVWDNEKYYVQGVENPGGVGIFQVLYCEKRQGVGAYESNGE